MPELFDMKLRAMRRDRAARRGVELFLYERAFVDCLERLALVQRRFERALLVGCPDPSWRERLGTYAGRVDVRDPGGLLAGAAGGEPIVEDYWEPAAGAYELVLSVGTLDGVNDLPLALRLVRHAMGPDSLFLGAMSGGDTLPQLRSAMRAADVVAGGASPHIHPRVEAAALAPLLADAGFIMPVVDVDRVDVAYPSFDRLVGDLRAMGATNVLKARSAPLSRQAVEAARQAFAAAASDGRTREIFEILHFAAWVPPGR
ncbi:MAG: SAM-dependent methyltransferase [Pseudomonadota bacterium]